MNTINLNPEIFSACRILFGSEITVTPEFLVNMRISDLTNRFKERALELHPDRAALLGKDASEMGELFTDVKLAYEKLHDIFASTPTNFSSTTVPHPENDNTATIDHYWDADIPDFPMLFGQFLYFAGLISLANLSDALKWQRNQRPSFGRIARMWNYIDQVDTRKILSARRSGELFGEAAYKQGLLTRFQKDAVMGLQRWLQRPIGEYFQAIGLLEDEEVVYLLKLMKDHNNRTAYGYNSEGGS